MILFKTIARRILISDLTGDFIRFFKNEVKLKSMRITISPKEIRGKIVSLLFFNKYEKEEIEMIQEFMRNDLPIIDLGSSLGVVATSAASISNDKIVCVEANPNLTEIIEKNLVANGVRESEFSVLNGAICDLGENDGAIYFSSRGSNELGRICSPETEGAIKVKTLLLSDLVKSNNLENFILISDIEGAEAAFLFSDSDALSNCSQLFIELHPVNWNGVDYSVKDLRNQIELLGFKQLEQRGMNFYYMRYGRN